MDDDEIARRRVQRDSDNPIVEEFKEELSKRPYSMRRVAVGEVDRIARLEGLVADLLERFEALERRFKALEGKR